MSYWIVFRYKRQIVLLLFVFISLFLVFSLLKNRKLNQNALRETHQEHRLAIVVPFRERFDELLSFVPYMHHFLTSQGIKSFGIYIINQSTRYRFNRGALINIGFTLARNRSDYIAMHDVDLIPLNANLSYAFPEKGPYHLSSPEYHPQYNYSKYFGGILLMSNEHFELVNGMSNRYFGWGLEDDEFYLRVKSANLPIFRPINLTTDKSNSFLHFHHDRKRDTYKSKQQRESLRRRDKITGLRNLRFSVTSSHNISIDHKYNCYLYNVEIFCDTKLTPWCLKGMMENRSTARPPTSTGSPLTTR